MYLVLLGVPSNFELGVREANASVIMQNYLKYVKNLDFKLIIFRKVINIFEKLVLCIVKNPSSFRSVENNGNEREPVFHNSPN